MSEVKAASFKSVSDFASKLLGLFQGPSFHAAFRRLDRRLIRKIMITASVSNDCLE